MPDYEHFYLNTFECMPFGNKCPCCLTCMTNHQFCTFFSAFLLPSSLVSTSCLLLFLCIHAQINNPASVIPSRSCTLDLMLPRPLLLAALLHLSFFSHPPPFLNHNGHVVRGNFWNPSVRASLACLPGLTAWLVCPPFNRTSPHPCTQPTLFFPSPRQAF